MKNVCSKIDHLVVLCPEPAKTVSEFLGIMGLPEYVPVVNHGYFESGLVHLGNVDIEFLRLGEPESQPCLYGLCFATELSIFDLCNELSQKSILFSLPVNTIIKKPVRMSWAVVFLKNFLDQPFPAGWLSSKIASPQLLIKKLTAFFGWLTSPQWIKKLFSRNTGKSMTFFCKFSEDQTYPRKQASKKLKQLRGGHFEITGVESVIVEYSDETHMEHWRKLLPMDGFSAGPQIQFQKGKINRLIGINLKSSLHPTPSAIHFGGFIIQFVS